jgi:hypothetical protein
MHNGHFEFMINSGVLHVIHEEHELRANEAREMEGGAPARRR